MTGTADFLIYGGYSRSKKMHVFENKDKLATIARTDLSTGTQRWAKAIRSFAGDGDRKKIKGLALKSDDAS